MDRWVSLQMIDQTELDVLSRALRCWLDENLGVAGSDDLDACYTALGKVREAKKRAGWVG
jgi:hypothetical protein